MLRPSDPAPRGSDPFGDGPIDGDAALWDRRWARAVVVVCIVALVIGGVLVLRSRPSVVAGPSQASLLGAPAAAGSEPPTASPSPATSGAVSVVVHVVGRVRRPGVVRLAAGARVSDAVTAAGGFVRRADAASINLARPLVDGEQIVIGGGSPAGGSSPGGPSGSTASGGAGPAGSAGGRLDLNAAAAADLERLPGVGPVLAQRIIDTRERLGRFSSVDDLRQVSGIGERRFADLEPLVVVR